MARKVDLKAKQAELDKRVAKIVTGYARITFTDGSGVTHQAGEYTELTQDEFDRTKRHRLLVSKDRFEAQAKLDEIDARERARLSAQLNGEDMGDESDAVDTGSSTTSSRTRAARPAAAKASSKRASSKRTATKPSD